MKKEIFLLLALNLFFMTVFVVITWNNIYIADSMTISAANHVFGVFLELLILNAVLLFTGSMRWLWARGLLLFILTVYFLVLMVQSFSIQVSGAPLVLAALYNIQEAPLLINSHTLAAVCVSVALFLVFLYLLSRNIFSGKLAVIYLCALAVIYPLALKYKHSNSFEKYSEQAEQQQFSHPTSPARDFYKVATLYLRERKTNAINMPSHEDMKVAERFNLIFDPQSSYPFLKKRIYDRKLKESDKNGNDGKPNVIVFFVESLSARMLGAYGNSYRNITPAIDQFAQNSLIITGYYNHTTPTAPGLFGQHCSLYPLLTGKELKKTENPISDLGTKCYPQYFKEAGYRTTYLSHTKPGKWHMSENLQKWGYKERYFWQALLNRYLGKEMLGLYFSGVSDQQMMRSIVNFMREYNQDEPFLVGVSTIETHVGFNLSKGEVTYADGNNSVLNMIHNFDYAFGLFWEYFKNSKYSSNTIVVLTGDHTPYQSRDYIESVGKDWNPSVFDEMSLIIYDPVHSLNGIKHINATSVDLAPSLLQLADINPLQNNAFLGRSIFEPRPFDAAFGISPYPDYKIFFRMGNHLVNEIPARIKDDADAKIYSSLYRILKYYEYLRQHGRLYPPDLPVNTSDYAENPPSRNHEKLSSFPQLPPSPRPSPPGRGGLRNVFHGKSTH